MPAWLPSSRSILIGLLVAVVAGLLYLAARETSMFAVRRIKVQGTPEPVAAEVRAALEPLLGTSLVTFDSGEAQRRLARLPDVAAASFDRAFPHTLRVFVLPEQPVAVLRQGADAWLASSRARVLRQLTRKPYPTLPRVWLPASVGVAVGQTLDGDPARALRTLAAVDGVSFPSPVQTARVDGQELMLMLRSGLEVRLGDGADLPLKLEIARRIVTLAPNASYIDVSVPGRSVAGYKAQVSG